MRLHDIRTSHGHTLPQDQPLSVGRRTAVSDGSQLCKRATVHQNHISADGKRVSALLQAKYSPCKATGGVGSVTARWGGVRRSERSAAEKQQAEGALLGC